ncbi:MAG: Rieske 2Fe-2S domain-containing protein [Candidatus Binatia bacterium]
MNQAKKKRPGRGKVVARTGELMHGTTKKFRLQCRGSTLEAILVNYEGKISAYVNRCCHISLTMDWVDNQFFTEDKRYLICANHGATYEPTAGECIWSPCFGAFLQSVPLEVSRDQIRAYCPEDKKLRE